MEIYLPTLNQSIRPGKILCIGKNYARHAAEMHSAVPEQPMVFLKPSTALVANGGRIEIPPASSEVHHEVELVAVIGRTGKNIDVSEALNYVDGYAVGLDMTARDIQQRAKEKGHPWSVAKGFDTFAPIGAFVAASEIPNPQNLSISLTINGEVRQEGHTGDMVFPVAQLISFCSSIFTLEPGDLLYTGTPEGVGAVAKGDKLVARLGEIPELHVEVH